MGVESLSPLMLIKILGMRDHIIWDKGAELDFKKPVRSDLTFHFCITDNDLSLIQQELDAKGKIVYPFFVKAMDREKDTCFEAKKLVYVRRKSHD